MAAGAGRIADANGLKSRMSSFPQPGEITKV
jgi:hypothetical protein